jgi:hypothetical protein
MVDIVTANGLTPAEAVSIPLFSALIATNDGQRARTCRRVRACSELSLTGAPMTRLHDDSVRPLKRPAHRTEVARGPHSCRTGSAKRRPRTRHSQ